MNQFRGNKFLRITQDSRRSWKPFVAFAAGHFLAVFVLFQLVWSKSNAPTGVLVQPSEWLRFMGASVVVLLYPFGYPIGHLLDSRGYLDTYEAVLLGAVANSLMLMLVIRVVAKYWRSFAGDSGIH